MLEFILDLLKITIPALAVGLTAYYVLRELLQRQERRDGLQLASTRQQITLPLRMQAYERLALLCERIAIPNLVLRTPRENLTAAQYHATLLLTVQQEFEHNITQQIYVGDQVWAIIKAARDDVAQLIGLAAEEAKSSQEMANRLLALTERREGDPLAMAQAALRKEIATLFH